MGIVRVKSYVRKGKRVRSYEKNMSLRGRIMKGLGKEVQVSLKRYGHGSFRTKRNEELRRRLAIVDAAADRQFKIMQVARWQTPEARGKKKR